MYTTDRNDTHKPLQYWVLWSQLQGCGALPLGALTFRHLSVFSSVLGFPDGMKQVLLSCESKGGK